MDDNKKLLKTAGRVYTTLAIVSFVCGITGYYLIWTILGWEIAIAIMLLRLSASVGDAASQLGNVLNG